MVVADCLKWLDLQLDNALDAGIGERRFWEMTPATLAELHHIHMHREMREYERAAWMVSWIMSAWVEKPPSVDDLLGRRRR